MLSVLSENQEWTVIGSVRNEVAAHRLPASLISRLVIGADLVNLEHIIRLFDEIRPQVVINCAGVTKHLRAGQDSATALAMNSVLPQRLAEICRIGRARLIHISTDCVFSGKTGNYLETDTPDASDVYGQTKHLGEVACTEALVLRTSTIGPEFGTRNGLLEWFFAQESCKGYRRAIFSGLPSMEFGRIVRDLVIPRSDLAGLFHVGGAAIDKYSLLKLIAEIYGRSTAISPDDAFVIDRSLNSDRFQATTGYAPPQWPNLIQAMREYTDMMQCSTTAS